MRHGSWVSFAFAVALLFVITAGCRSRDIKTDTARPTITSEKLLRHIEVLASDDFEGRAPGTRGEKLTVAYLSSEFRQTGLQPVSRDGTFVQRVPLVGSTATGHKALVTINEQQFSLPFPTQFVAWTKQVVPEIKVDNSEVVFVGYGVVAPEYGWDDYKGVDVRGKTIVFLINDPAVPDPKDPAKLDPAVFKGNEMTYYGRWTYKFEIAAQRGAAAAVIVHETGPAGYPWAVVTGSNSRENFDLHTRDGNTNRAQVEGWITLEKAKELFTAAGQDFDTLKRAALSRNFKPVPLRATASFQFKNTLRDVISHNVVGKIDGADPRLRDECIVYTAHWDHLGIEPGRQGDKVFNGARDNATGVASLLEIARSFALLKEPPKRSILFLAVTAEEKGLLGAKHYAQNPLMPIERTIANLNMDSMNPWGRTRDVTVIGMGQTTIEETLHEVASTQGRRLIADPEPEKGRYFRSDHFEFAKVGVPGLYLHGGIDFIGKPSGFGLQKTSEYIANDYHKVTDEIKTDWDLSGAAEDTWLLFEVGRRIANAEEWPAWKETSEFRKLRPGR